MGTATSARGGGLPVILFVGGAMSLRALFPTRGGRPRGEKYGGNMGDPIPFSLILVRKTTCQHPSNEVIAGYREMYCRGFHFVSATVGCYVVCIWRMW